MKKENRKIDFKVPEGYFDSLTSQIMDIVTEEGKIFPDKHGFSVPRGYMDGFPEKIFQRLQEPETKLLPIRRPRKYYYYAASIAAALLLFFGILWSGKDDPTYSDLARTDIEEYFDLNGWGFSPYELAEILPVEQIDLSGILEQQLDNEKVIDYLDNNIKNIEELNLDRDD